MLSSDAVYYDMAPNPHTRGGRRRMNASSRVTQSQQSKQQARQPVEMSELGIGSRTCFSFRVPRTITTSDMSEGEASQTPQQQHHYQQHQQQQQQQYQHQNQHANANLVEKQGLLQAQESRSAWMNSPVSHTTASMTTTPASSPESDGTMHSSTRGSLLSMPTPTDRSHQRRLQMERGRPNTYDGEQEPAGYRGQEASPLPMSKQIANHTTTVTTTTTPIKRSNRVDSKEQRVDFDGEMDLSLPVRKTNPSTTVTASKSAHLLSMPAPKDRSHRKRLELETLGISYRYEGEQAPSGHQSEKFTTPPASSQTLSNPSFPNESRLGQSNHVQHRNEREKRLKERRHDGTPSKSDSLVDNTVRNAVALARSERQDMDNRKEEPRPGSPYLQFSPEGPTIRGFETSRRLNQKVLSSATVLDSDDVSIGSDDHLHMILGDLSPLSPASHENVASNQQHLVQSRSSIETTKKVTVQPMIRASTQSRGYGTETTESSSTVSPDPPAYFNGKLKHMEVVTPERKALTVLRSGSYDEGSVKSASTRSSENLRSMMGDLLSDEASDMPIPAEKLTKQPNVNEMALAAQNSVEQGDYDVALTLFGKVLDFYLKQYGERHPLVASAYHNMGMVHALRSDLLLEGTLQQTHVRQQALQCFQRAARTARDSLGKNHPNVAVSLVKIGFLLLQERQFNPALVTFEEALRIRTTHYVDNPHHPLIANLHNNIGVAHLHMQNFRESKRSLTKALTIQRHNLRVKRLKCTREDLRVRLLEVADTLANLGGLGLECLQHEGAYESIMWEAESDLAEALEIRSTVLGPQHPLSIQVRSLHDMVRSSSSLMPADSGSSIRSGPYSDHSRDVSQKTGSSNRAVIGIDDSDDARKRSKSGLTSQATFDSGSPARSVKKSKDAPGPKAYSSTQLLELITQSVAARKSNGTTSPTRSRNPVTRASRASSETLPTVTPRDPASSVVEVVPFDEGEFILDNTPRRRARTPEKTKIFIEPHFIPRQSPTRAASSPGGSLFSEARSPAVGSSSLSESSLGPLSSSHAYDAEESCLISGGGSKENHLSTFLFQRGDDDANFENTSSHEIMVVRPTATAIDRESLGQYIHPSMNRRSSGEANRKYLSPPQGNANKDFDENDDGIAVLSRQNKPFVDQTVRFSKAMLETPERHLVEIHAIASRYLKKNRLQEAKLLFITILDCQRQVHGELHEDVGAALHNVGLVNLRLNDHSQALTNFQLAARVRKGSLGSAHPDVAISLVKVGISLMLKHEFDAALQAFFEALSIRKRALGALHPSLARVYNNIACVHVEFNELREARRAFEAALDIQRNALCHEPDSGPLMFGAATTLCNLGYLYRFRERHQKAALVLKEALELQESVLCKTHPTVIATMDSLADALSLSGGCSQALQYYEEILSRLEYGDDVSNRRQAEAVVLYKMSRAHRRQNDIEAEVVKLDQALLAIQASEAATFAERNRKEELEKRILLDIRASLGELKQIRLGQG